MRTQSYGLAETTGPLSQTKLFWVQVKRSDTLISWTTSVLKLMLYMPRHAAVDVVGDVGKESYVFHIMSHSLQTICCKVCLSKADVSKLNVSSLQNRSATRTKHQIKMWLQDVTLASKI